MQAKHSLEFSRAPSLWSLYPKIMTSRKPALVPEGGEVPRIESRLSKVVIDRRHLAAYSDLCGAAAGATLPIAYPHVLAMPLHLTMLGAEAFPVKLFGLVHVQNRIAQRQPLSADEPAEIRAWIEGHRDTERGQEFELHTEYVVNGESLWDETCTFLARKRTTPGAAKAALAAVRSAEGAPDGVAVKSSSFRAPAGLGRRYGFISGDVNPIHMSDLTAKAFGFPRAIAHGMWSLARVASDFDAKDFEGCEFLVNFKLPIYMPSWLMLQRWPVENGNGFALRDAQGEKPHVTGALKSLR